MRKPPGRYQHSSDAAKNNIPSELQKFDQWVAWKFEQREGSSKPTKVPVNPHTLRNASCNDPTTWGSFEAALDCLGSLRHKKPRRYGVYEM